MRIKENFPWSIQSPVIHLVQPSPTIPLEHEIVFRHGGTTSNAIYALAAQDKEDEKQKVARREEQKVFKDKKESNLSCGFISPPIHQALEDTKKTRNSFYDLRNDRSMSTPTEKLDKPVPSVTSRSKSVDEGSSIMRRKTSPDFEDILRDLGCVSSDPGDSSTSASWKSHREIKREDSSSTVLSGVSDFCDVSLNDQIEGSKTSPVDSFPRKSFSEETFDKNRLNLMKERTKMLQMVKRKERTSSVGSSEDGFEMWGHLHPHDRRRVSQMVDDLLIEIYGNQANKVDRRRSCTGLVRGVSSASQDGDNALYEDAASYTECTSESEPSRRSYLQRKGKFN